MENEWTRIKKKNRNEEKKKKKIIGKIKRKLEEKN